MEYHIYEGKDGRVRAYDPETQKIVSYPRILMAQKLGRPLDPLEQVHHKDGNPLNNEIDNLEIIKIGEHQKMHQPTKYQDKMEPCQYCRKEFLWTAKQQSEFYRNRARGDRKNHEHPFCSKSCVGKYGRQEQLRGNAQVECE